MAKTPSTRLLTSSSSSAGPMLTRWTRPRCHWALRPSARVALTSADLVGGAVAVPDRPWAEADGTATRCCRWRVLSRSPGSLCPSWSACRVGGTCEDRRTDSGKGLVRVEHSTPERMPDGYAQWLLEVKARVQATQVRAVRAVNSEVIMLYWSIGRDIVERQGAAGWGAKVIRRIAADLSCEFPGQRGWSPTSLKYMRVFAQAWPELGAIGPQVVGQLPWGHIRALLDPACRAPSCTASVRKACRRGQPRSRSPNGWESPKPPSHRWNTGPTCCCPPCATTSSQPAPNGPGSW